MRNYGLFREFIGFNWFSFWFLTGFIALMAWEIVGFIIVFGFDCIWVWGFLISRSEGGYSTPSASSFYREINEEKEFIRVYLIFLLHFGVFM